MPKLLIDGEEFEAPEGSTILQAALGGGREIPHYCYHPGLSISGNCRMCLVEVEKAPKLSISCQTVVQDGMVVNTLNDRVKEAQAAVMEFLLINHPLDCPICDQAGECRLQDYAVAHGTGVSRYTESKLALSKAVDIGDHVLLDQERCIQCSRCIRFCDEVTGTSELAFFQRGNHTSIGTFPGRRLDNPYSGNVVDICPVGALTLKEFRFRTRVWYLKNTPSICAGCSRGCNVIVATGNQQVAMTTRGQLDDRIKRIVPRVNESVNGHWICDEGRLSYERLDAATRLSTAQDSADRKLEWDAAVKRMADALGTAAREGKAAAILSPRLTSETLYAWKRLFDALGGVKVGVRRLTRGADDELLIRADRGANSTGAAWIFGDRADESSVLDAVGRGEIHTLLIAGDSLDPDDTVVLDAARRAKLEHVIYAGPFLDAAARQATLLLPTAAWAEEDGTMVNFEGRIQRVRRSRVPRGEGRPGWRVAADVAGVAELEWPEWTDANEVLNSLSASVAPYSAITEEKIGLLGIAGAASAAGV